MLGMGIQLGRYDDEEEAEVTGQRWQCNSGVIGVINNRLQLSRYDEEEEEEAKWLWAGQIISQYNSQMRDDQVQKRDYAVCY